MRRLIAVLAIAIGLGTTTLAEPARADSFEIESMQVLARVNTDGSMDIVERLTYDFDGEFNGGTRTIPEGDYSIGGFQVTENGEPRDLPPGYDDPNFGEVRWFGSGDHSKVSGRHTYDLSYRVFDAVEVAPDVGVLNWKFVGFDFPAMELVEVDVTMPGDGTDLRAFAHGDLRGVVIPEGNTVHLRVPENPANSAIEARIVVPAAAFSGVTPSGPPMLDSILAEEAALADTANAARDLATEAYAAQVAQGMEGGCDDESSSALDAACARLESLLEEAGSPGNGEPLTLEDADTYFSIIQTRRVIADEVDRIVAAREERFGNLAAPAITVVVLLVWYLFWRKVGKEPERPSDIGEYWREVPEQSPAVVAAIEGWGVVDNQAFASTVLDLAQRGWLTITEEGDGHRFTRTQQTTDEVPLRDYESKALWKLFEDGRPTITQDLLVADAKKDRTESASWMSSFKAQIQNDYNQQRIQEKKGCGPFLFHLFLVLVLAGTSVLALALGAFVGCAIAGAAALVLLPLGGFLRRRTEAGNRKHLEIQGLKRFLRDFSLVDDVPVGHLALYERYLVYAVALGVADRLIAGLRMRFPELANPDAGFAPWYIGPQIAHSGTGGLGSFDKLASVGSVGSFAHDFSSVTASAFSVPSSSSGSGGGFSGGGGGGGFSGGGGGGGAGAW